MKTPNDTRIAVLIDADNIPSANVKAMMEEIAKYGTPTFKRIYGDWTKPNLAGWKNVLLENAIAPIQQYGYTTGKNATDSAMIIDAMDILYSDKVDAFCIVSSDSDFTRLAATLKEEGKTVIGMGESKTPNALVNACDYFKYVDVLYKDSEAADRQDDKQEEKSGEKKSGRNKKAAAVKTTKAAGKAAKGAENAAAKTAASAAEVSSTTTAVMEKPAVYSASAATTKLSTIEKSIHQIIEANGDDEGMNISLLKSNLQRRFPDFDTRNYGTAKFSKFLAQFKSLKMVESGGSTNVNII